MPRVAKELSALEVKRLTHPGKGRNATFAVGGRLWAAVADHTERRSDMAFADIGWREAARNRFGWLS